MPEPIAYQIVEALRGRLAGITPAGGFFFDLSAAGAVVIGAAAADSSLSTRVELTWDGEASAFEGTTLRHVAEELRIGILARAQYTSDTTASRVLIATRLQSDIKRRIEADMRLGLSPSVAAIRDSLIVSSVDVIDETGYQSTAGVSMTLRIRYRRPTGTA